MHDAHTVYTLIDVEFLKMASISYFYFQKYIGHVIESH